MQVLSLTQEQINALPEQERGTILQLVRICFSSGVCMGAKYALVFRVLLLALAIHGNSQQRLTTLHILKRL